MRLEQLEYIVEVADNKQINLVANKLFVTAQNISKSIKQLEDELNVKIFNRTKYGMFLTTDGELIYNVAHNILKQINFLEDTFNQKTTIPVKDIKGSLSIVAAASMNLIGHNLLKKLLHTYPNISVTYSEQETNSILPILSNEKDTPDIIFVSCGKDMISTFEQYKEKYEIYILKEEATCVLMSVKSPYAKQQSISLKTLATLPLAGFISIDAKGEKQYPFVENLLNRYGIKLNYIFLSDSYYNWERYIEDGIAYGLVGSDYMSTYRKECENKNVSTITVPLKEKIITNHMMIIPKLREITQQQEVFKNMVQQYFQQTFCSLK